jgi:hypothetical protein
MRKETMKNHLNLTFITALALSVLVAVAVIAGSPAQQVKGQLPNNDVASKYLQGLDNKLNVCKDNPFNSHNIPAIVIPGNASGKNGGITAYGNANSEHGKNGPISIGGGYNGKGNSVSPNTGDLGGRAGNGGVAFCGSANGQNVKSGGP